MVCLIQVPILLIILQLIKIFSRTHSPKLLANIDKRLGF